MRPTAKPPDVASAGFDLIGAVPVDVMQFGHGQQFKAEEVVEFLRLTKTDVSRLASVAEDDVRYDTDAPAVVRKGLEEIAAMINLVARQFDGDAEKSAAWFRARNPMLGDVSPLDMIRQGRHDRLRGFIERAVGKQDEGGRDGTGGER